MEKINNAYELFINVCRKCADECITNSLLCREVGLIECAQICEQCAKVCNKTIIDGLNDIELVRQCADACNSCAASCDEDSNSYCRQCA